MVSRAPSRTQGRTQYRHPLHGRHGLVRPRLLRLGDRHAAYRRARGERPALHPLHQSPDLLSRTGGAADRHERPRGRHRMASQQQSWLPRLFRRDPAGRPDDGGDAARGRLCHLHDRQMAQYADRGQHARIAQAQLAGAARLRPFLRVHGGRGAFLLSRLRHDGQPAAADRRVPARLLCKRRLDEQEHPVRQGIARLLAGTALPALHRA